uniref:peptidylprolyl isomerase n=1 Tax=Gasterosteus aculeatus aculeatus TaxID=481459 RepID=A0AAQ4RK11_GASAC
MLQRSSSRARRVLILTQILLRKTGRRTSRAVASGSSSIMNSQGEVKSNPFSNIRSYFSGDANEAMGTGNSEAPSWWLKSLEESGACGLHNVSSVNSCLKRAHRTKYISRHSTKSTDSREHGDKNPVWFTLGMQEVLKGWDKGLKNMCTGERRKLTIPPSLGYGKEGKGKIPPSSILIFHIELMDIRNGPRSHESFREMDLNDDWKLCREEVKEYLKKEFEKHGYSPNDTNHEAMVEDIFKNEDEDKDGFISAREFTYQHDEL